MNGEPGAVTGTKRGSVNAISVFASRTTPFLNISDRFLYEEDDWHAESSQSDKAGI